MTGQPVFAVMVTRRWEPICPPAGGLPGIDARYAGIGGGPDGAWVVVELREAAPPPHEEGT